MRKLRKVGILFLGIFLTNTLFVSVFADPCLKSEQTELTSASAASDGMPCHGNTTENNTKHCKDRCMCLEGLVSPIQFFNNVQAIKIPVITSYINIFKNDAITTRMIAPLRRPPILLS